MARKKIKIQWIVDNAARKATYKKRVKGLLKKVRELSILCGVDACAITYSPYHQEPEVWPSPIEVEQVLAAFRSRPENNQTKKVLNQENFIWQRIFKARDELVKQQMKNRKNEIENLRTQCLGGKLVEGLESKDLIDLMWAIDNQLAAVKNRIGDVRAVGAFTSIDAVSHVGAASGVNTAVWGVGDVPISAIGAGNAAVGGTNATAKTSFDLAIDDLNNQLLTEQNQNENMDNGLGDLLDYDVSDFWRNPYIL